MGNILLYGKTELFLEMSAEIVFTDIKMLGNGVESERGGDVIVYVNDDILYKTIALCTLSFGETAEGVEKLGYSTLYEKLFTSAAIPFQPRDYLVDATFLQNFCREVISHSYGTVFKNLGITLAPLLLEKIRPCIYNDSSVRIASLMYDSVHLDLSCNDDISEISG